MKHETSIVIFRKRSVIFEHITHPEKLRAWVRGFVSASDAIDLAESADYHQTTRIGWGVRPLKGNVMVYERDSRFIFDVQSKAVKVTVEFRLYDEDGTSTRLSMLQQIEPRGSLSKLILPLIDGSVRRKQEDDLRRLKVLLDQGSAPRGG